MEQIISREHKCCDCEYGYWAPKRWESSNCYICTNPESRWKDRYLAGTKTIQSVCCENRLELRAMKPMTCEKCGAPLKGCECEYCGTRYYIPNVETTTFWADNKQVMQVEKELNQAKFDAVNQVQLNDIQNMVNQLRMLGGNGSIEYMLNSGVINAATAREMYMTKMANLLK